MSVTACVKTSRLPWRDGLRAVREERFRAAFGPRGGGPSKKLRTESVKAWFSHTLLSEWTTYIHSLTLAATKHP